MSSGMKKKKRTFSLVVGALKIYHPFLYDFPFLRIAVAYVVYLEWRTAKTTRINKQGG